ncbi:hypothetical protein BU17DRAFT_89987 [Hysterangium stoloniferum]|nr:hypothetical protein BU17DRAFT_89987 [Hysterangium stoloniferum]
MANPKSQIEWCNKIDTLLKQAPPSMSHAGFNQAITLIWTFIINVTSAIVGWVQASLVQSVQIAMANIAQSKSASIPIKCMKCSTKGHQALACRSKNPQAVRRQIAANNKKRTCVTPLPDYSSLITPPYPLPPLTPQYAAFTADAAKLQRCQAQSRRDHSHAKKKGPSTSAQAATTTSSKSKLKK